MKQSQISLFDNDSSEKIDHESTLPTNHEPKQKRKVIIFKWDKLSYGCRCCLGEMAGLSEKYIENVLAKQSKAEIENWIKGMLCRDLERRTNGMYQYDFQPIVCYHPDAYPELYNSEES